MLGYIKRLFCRRKVRINKLVRQRHKKSCGIACISMLTNFSYEDVIEDSFFGGRDFDSKEMTLMETQEYLRTCGISTKMWMRKGTRLKTLPLGILRIDVGRGHAVVNDGIKIYDPEGTEWSFKDILHRVTHALVIV